MRKLIACGVGLVAVLVLSVPGAFGSQGQTPGLTAKTITIGGTFPLTGFAAAYAPIPLGMKAYFSYINARKGPDGKRGIYGRQIVWKYYDDAYNVAQTALLTRRLVEQDKVFATVGQLGTEPVQSVREYMNGKKVPQSLVSTGASEFGLKYKQFPWTIGWQPDYIGEARLYGSHLKANFNGKKIAIIYQNDDYGKDYLYGFRAGLGKAYSDANIVAAEPIEPSATSAAAQVIKVRATGAPVFVVLQLPTPTVRTIATAKALGYNPEQIYMNSVSAFRQPMLGMIASAGAPYVNGIISAAYIKDADSPDWANDPAMKLYNEIVKKYLPDRDPREGQIYYGVAKAETFVQAMYAAGKNPTRASYMAALLSMDNVNKFALPGVKQKTSAKDHFIISQMQLERYNATDRRFVRFGALRDGRPRGR